MTNILCWPHEYFYYHLLTKRLVLIHLCPIYLPPFYQDLVDQCSVVNEYRSMAIKYQALTKKMVIDSDHWQSRQTFNGIKARNLITHQSLLTQFVTDIPGPAQFATSLQHSTTHSLTPQRYVHSFRNFLPDCVHHNPIVASSCIYAF